jgi:dTDP-4-amino-4,6-dideoxygalactose transaminase
MKEDFLPFALPDIGEEEIAEVVDSLRSGWITTGPKTKRFERDFAAYLGEGVQAVAVNSATAGLHLALEALEIGPGDEVITTSYTFTATAEVIRYLGADVKLVDIDPVTYCIDTEGTRRAIGPRTKAIIPVHYGGMACDMDTILAVAREHGLHVVEDAAHAFPTFYKSRLIGTLASDVTVFSFYATKTIATGEGGMLVTRDDKIARRARVMRLHGMNRDAFDRYTTKTPSWYYDIVAPGFKYNMTDLAASLGIHQLRKADRFLARRRALADRYDKELADTPLLLPPRPRGNSTHAWHLYVVHVGDGARVDRDGLIEKMFKAGIGCSVHYTPLHLLSYWKQRYKLKPQDFPHATAAYGRAVSIPLYTRMTDDDQTRVIRTMRSILT